MKYYEIRAKTRETCSRVLRILRLLLEKFNIAHELHRNAKFDAALDHQVHCDVRVLQNRIQFQELTRRELNRSLQLLSPFVFLHFLQSPVTVLKLVLSISLHAVRGRLGCIALPAGMSSTGTIVDGALCLPLPTIQSIRP